MRQEHELPGRTDSARLASFSQQEMLPSTPGSASLLSLPREHAHLQILLVLPAREAAREVARRLSDAGYAVAVAHTAYAAIEYVEQQPVDGIVLDLDASYGAGARQTTISGFRLLELLWRAVHTRPVALVVLTALDYAEIDDVLLRRVDALLSRLLPAMQLVERLEAVLGRVVRRRQAGVVALATAPMAAPRAE